MKELLKPAGTLTLVLLVLSVFGAGNSGWVGTRNRGPEEMEAKAGYVPEARLLVQMKLRNIWVVDYKDVVIDYYLFNIGGTTATNILLKDLNSPTNYEILGFSEVYLGAIPAQMNASYTLVIRPKGLSFGDGYFNFSGGVVTYYSGENADQVLTVHGSDAGHGHVFSHREFDRRFSSHYVDWIAFGIMVTPPLVIPFILWYTSMIKYEKLLKMARYKKYN